MTIKKEDTFSIESLSPEDKKRFFDAIKEIESSLHRIEAEKNVIKAVIDGAHNSYGVPKKLVRKMAKTYFKSSFADDVAEHEKFETLYHVVCE